MDKNQQGLDGLVEMMNMANTGENSSRKNGRQEINPDGIKKYSVLGKVS